MADSEHTYKESKDRVAEARTSEAFEAGYKARLEGRICDLAFDELCPDTWKRSWVEAEIAIGLVKRQAAL